MTIYPLLGTRETTAQRLMREARSLDPKRASDQIYAAMLRQAYRELDTLHDAKQEESCREAISYLERQRHTASVERNRV